MYDDIIIFIWLSSVQTISMYLFLVHSLLNSSLNWPEKHLFMRFNYISRSTIRGFTVINIIDLKINQKSEKNFDAEFNSPARVFMSRTEEKRKKWTFFDAEFLVSNSCTRWLLAIKLAWRSWYCISKYILDKRREIYIKILKIFQVKIIFAHVLTLIIWKNMVGNWNIKMINHLLESQNLIS